MTRSTAMKYRVDIFVGQFYAPLCGDTCVHGGKVRKKGSEGSRLLQSLMSGGKP